MVWWYGHTKTYPTKLSVIKTAFTLAHGTAEVERELCDSGKFVTVDRTPHTEASVNSLRIATDGLKVFGSLWHHVQIIPLFMKLAQSAHKNVVCESKKKEKRKLKKEERSNK